MSAEVRLRVRRGDVADGSWLTLPSRRSRARWSWTCCTGCRRPRRVTWPSGGTARPASAARAGGPQAMVGLERAVRGAALEPGLLELVRIRASQSNGCAYCLAMHNRDARARGEHATRLDTVAAWQEAPLFDERYVHTAGSRRGRRAADSPVRAAFCAQPGGPAGDAPRYPGSARTRSRPRETPRGPRQGAVLLVLLHLRATRTASILHAR